MPVFEDQVTVTFWGVMIIKEPKPLDFFAYVILHWSKILATFFYTQNLPQQISKLEKTTQALSVYRKGTFHAYIKCLIVISWKVTIKRKGLEKGHTLAYWFEQTMELGDAVDNEAPPPCPRKREMLKYSHLQMIAMLQSMQGDDGLQKGSITIIPKRFDVAHSTLYQLWEWAAHMCAMGDIISPEINSWGKIWEASYISKRVHPGGCQGCPAAEEANPKKTCDVDGVSKTTVHCWIVVLTIHVHCNSLKPVLTEEKKVARLLMA